MNYSSTNHPASRHQLPSSQRLRRLGACLLAMLAMAAVAFLPVPLAAQQQADRHVEVVGTAQRQVPVDTVTWSLSVRIVSPSVAEAAAELDEVVDALHERLAGLESDHVQARGSLVRTGRETERVNDEVRHIGYHAFCRIQLECRDLDLMTGVQALLLTDDRIAISAISATHSEAPAIKQEVLREAALAARDKARMLAELMDCELGDPLLVNEGRGSGQVVTLTSNRIEMPQFGQALHIDLDHLTITESVTVRFALRPLD